MTSFHQDVPSSAIEVIHKGLFTLTLHREIGRGAFSTVFTCSLSSSASGLDRIIYACKRIPLMPETERCFLEASLMVSIDHPFLCSAHLVLYHQNHLYIVQDLAQDGDMTRASHHATPALKRKWVQELVQAVVCLHQEGVIHGDIKTANILHGPDHSIRLGDFSLAVKRWSGCAAVDERFQTILSTVTHRAPEVFDVVAVQSALASGQTRRHWDEAADLWSLGCTIYELWMGKSLFGHVPDRDDETLKQIQRWALAQGQTWPASFALPVYAKDKTVPTLLPDVVAVSTGDADVDDLIRRCLVLDPAARITAREALALPLFTGVFLPEYQLRTLVPGPLSPSQREELTLTLSPHVVMQSPLGKVLLKSTLGIVVRLRPDLQRRYPFSVVCLAALRIAQRLAGVRVLLSTPDEQAVEEVICTEMLFRFFERYEG